MNNAVILHGTGGSPKDNWFPWLKKELVKIGYKVWLPKLPGADKPNVCTYNPFLSENWEYDGETIMIGHSSGATSILGFLNKMPKDFKIKKAILVAGFTDDLGWDNLSDLFIYKFDWEKIRSKADEFIFVHSDDDPYVDPKYGRELKNKLAGKLTAIKGQKHFSISTAGEKYRKFPGLLKMV